MAAILLDSDFTTAAAVVRRLFEPVIDALPSADELKDPKSRLQEYWQARQAAPPEYHLISATGPDHAQTFTVCCEHGDQRFTADGSSRRKAEQAAALKMLEALRGQK